MSPISAREVHELVRKTVAAAFPRCRVETNDDHNPASPLMVRMRLNKRLVKAHRAQVPIGTAEQASAFAQAAIARFRYWYDKDEQANARRPRDDGPATDDGNGPWPKWG